MSRILVRAAKRPWVPVSPESVLAQNVIATNIGNLLFGQSVMRALSTPENHVVPNAYLGGRSGVTEDYIDRINTEFDHFAIPLANAFRPSFIPNLQRLSSIIEKLDIPVTVIGVGSQHPLHGTQNNDEHLNLNVTRFMRAVLDRSSKVGVRGEETAHYLNSLGFGSEHVEVIGCPSIFMNGASPHVRAADQNITKDSKIVTSCSPATHNVASLIRRLAEEYPNLTHIPQNSWDLNTMVWAERKKKPNPTSDLVNPESPLHKNDQIRFPLDPKTWVEFLRDADFKVGTRIHGTIASVLAGTPALLVAHDSRTRELAEYHHLPHVAIDSISEDTDLTELYPLANYEEFHKNLPATFERFTNFLEINDLSNVYSEGITDLDFDRKLNEAKLPPMTPPILAHGGGAEQIASRLLWLRQDKATDAKRGAFSFTPDLPHTPSEKTATPAETINHLEAAIKTANSQIRTLQKETESLTQRLNVPIGTRIRRGIKRRLQVLKRTSR